ncbi:MAG: N-acetylmuramoyl-L-alanine amidase family protein [Acetobacteraceae bacterium]
MENSLDRGPLDPALRGLRPDVAGILGSLETRATDLSSKRIANDLIAAFRGYVDLFERPEESANFAVLRDPTIPSTLTEMGFLSNPEDERLLVSQAYRARIAERITVAVERYFHSARQERLAG